MADVDLEHGNGDAPEHPHPIHTHQRDHNSEQTEEKASPSGKKKSRPNKKRSSGSSSVKDNLVEFGVYTLLSYTTANAFIRIIELCTKRIRDKRWHLWVYVILFAVMMTVLVVIFIIQADDNPDNDLF